MIYTSGTTGKPKGALRTTTDAGDRLRLARASSGSARRRGAPHDRPAVPLGAAGVRVARAHDWGARSSCCASSTPSAWLRLVARAPRHQHVLGAHAAEAHRQPAARRARARRPLVDALPRSPTRRPVPYALKQEVIEKLGDGFLYEVYGSTELGIVTVLQARGPAAQAGIVRQDLRPHRGAHRPRRRHRGRDVGEPGELFIRTDAGDGRLPPHRRAADRARRGRVEVGRRRRVRRRRGLPLHLRPQEGHDHLRGREHLPGGDRSRAARAPAGARRRPCSASPTTSGARACTRSSSRSRARRPRLDELRALRRAARRRVQAAACVRGARRAAPHRLRQAAEADAARRVLAGPHQARAV